MKSLLIMMTAIIASVGINQQIFANPSSACEGDEICYQDNALTPLLSQEEATMLENQQYNNVILNSVDVAENYSSLPRRIGGEGERGFIFSPRLLQWAAYDSQGYQVAAGKANGGSSFCEDLQQPCLTPRGAFRVHSKGTAACISKKFPIGEGGAPMPYCMYFNGGYAIHGSPYISNRNTSHGCIRVHTAAARWLHYYFMNPGTKVVVLPY